MHVATGQGSSMLLVKIQTRIVPTITLAGQSFNFDCYMRSLALLRSSMLINF